MPIKTYEVVGTCKKPCGKKMPWAFGLLIDLDNENDLVKMWIKKGRLKEIKDEKQKGDNK